VSILKGLVEGMKEEELDDDPERKDATEIAAIKWFFEAFREEAENIRGHTKLLDEVLNGKVAGPSPKPGVTPRAG
jgi:hypothetical protein